MMAKKNQENKKEAPRWAIILVVIVIALVVLFFGGLFIGDQTLKAPRVVGDQFVTYIVHNDPIAAYNQLAAAQKQSFKESDMVTYFKNYSPHFQGSESFYGGIKETVNNFPQSVLIYKFTGKGPTVYLKLTLADVNSKWYVTGFLGKNSPPLLNLDTNE